MSLKDSVTLAAICTLAANTGRSEASVLKDFSSYLLELFEQGMSAVGVNQPCTLTISKPGGAFGKQSLIGEEEVEITGAYMGKRDGVILRAASKRRGEILYEIPAQTAEEILDGYEEIVEQFIQTYGMDRDADDMASAGSAAKELELEAHKKAVLETRMQDERFGSW